MIEQKVVTTESMEATDDRQMPTMNKWAQPAEDATPLIDIPDDVGATQQWKK